MTVQQPAPQPAAKPTIVVLPAGKRAHANIYSHSGVFYWWPVWAYGYFCAAMTYAYGKPIKLGDDKTILFYPDAWLGLSFLGVFLFVLVFSTTEARGIYSYVVAMIVAALIFAIPRTPGFESLAARVPDLRIHMNLAFFIVIASSVLFLWLLMVLVIDRFTYWKFEPGHVTEKHVIGQAGDTVFPTLGMVARRMPTDFFRHWILGFGSGDIRVTPSNQQSIEIKNVLRVKKKLAQIEAFVGAHANVNQR
jgi:hypothetical protein